MFLEEIVAYLISQSVGPSTRIIAASTGQVPIGENRDPILTVTETGGSAPERTHNAVLTPAYQRPSGQVICRAEDYPAARAMLKLAYLALVKVRNQNLSSVWYREISPLQEPFDLSPDEKGRARCAFNFVATKRPS